MKITKLVDIKTKAGYLPINFDIMSQIQQNNYHILVYKYIITKMG